MAAAVRIDTMKFSKPEIPHFDVPKFEVPDLDISKIAVAKNAAKFAKKAAQARGYLVPEKKPSFLTRFLHDIGLAVWFGGSVFGILSLNPSVEVLDDPEERGKMVDEAWARFQPYGALGMLICQFLVAIIGVSVGFNHTHVTGIVDGVSISRANNIGAVNAQIAFIAIFIFFFASTWGPGAWIVIGEIFPLPIRSRGVGISTASNWLWNTIIAVITPYMVGPQYGNLKSSVFFVWGGLCTCAFVYSYFLIPETKGLSLEQVDRMMEETTPRNSAKWVPHDTFSSAMGHKGEKLGFGGLNQHEDVEKHSV